MEIRSVEQCARKDMAGSQLYVYNGRVRRTSMFAFLDSRGLKNCRSLNRMLGLNSVNYLNNKNGCNRNEKLKDEYLKIIQRLGRNPINLKIYE